jgi:hypothetical protein
LADQKLPPETNMVLGLRDHEKVQKYRIFPNRKVYYLAFGSRDVLTDPTDLVTAPQNGVIMIFPVLDYLGYKEINLIGCDMNRLASYGKQMQNFYKEDPRKNATSISAWTDIISNLNCELIAFKQYKAFFDHFSLKKVSMYNLSTESWLTFIEKRDFDIALKR